MATKRNAQERGALRTLHVRVDPAKLDRFREVVEAEDNRTVSQELRHYIDRRLAGAPPEREAA